MTYRLTFEDGSSAYLAHHGTKGMKWGVWNAETAARYRGGQGHRSITRANKKVNKRFQEYEDAAKRQGDQSYQAKSAAKRLGDAVEKREFLVEKNRPGEGNINPDRYNELRSNQRVTRSTITGALVAGPFGGISAGVVSSALSSYGKRAVSDVIKGRETYRINEQTGQYERTSPWNTESNRYANSNPVYVKQSTYANNNSQPKYKQNGYSSEAEHRAAIERAVKQLSNEDGGKIVSTYYDNKSTDTIAKSAKQTKEYRQGVQEGYHLMTKGFDVNRNNSDNRKQVASARDGLGKLASDSLAKGDTKAALNAMAKAETMDAWLNSKNDAEFKKKIGL